MKKSWSILLVLIVLALLFSGCKEYEPLIVEVDGGLDIWEPSIKYHQGYYYVIGTIRNFTVYDYDYLKLGATFYSENGIIVGRGEVEFRGLATPEIRDFAMPISISVPLNTVRYTKWTTKWDRKINR